MQNVTAYKHKLLNATLKATFLQLHQTAFLIAYTNHFTKTCFKTNPTFHCHCHWHCQIKTC